jgi:hypothetical protein
MLFVQAARYIKEVEILAPSPAITRHHRHHCHHPHHRR